MSTINNHRRLSFFATLLPILFVAAWLRLAALQEPVWLDELHTSWCVSSSLWEVFTRAMSGNQTPLYFWLVWPVYQGLGESAFALRLVSLVASILLVFSIGGIVFRWTGSLVGTALATGLAAVDDKFLFYAVEARPYVLVQLAAVWQVTFFVKLLFPHSENSDDNQVAGSAKDLSRFWLLSNVLLWLHPTTIVVLLSEFIIFFSLSVKRTGNFSVLKWRVLEPTNPFLGPLGLAFPVVIIMMLWAQRQSWEAFVNPDAYFLLTAADWIVCLAVPMLAYFFVGQQPNGQWRWIVISLVVILLSTIGPLLATWMNWVPLADYRYTISAATLVVVVAGCLTGMLASQRLKLLACGIVTGLAVATNPLLPGFVRTGHVPAQRAENWKEIVDRINSDKLPVCLYPNLIEDAWLEEHELDRGHAYLEYLQFALRGLYPLEGTDNPQVVVEVLSLISPQPLTLEAIGRFDKAGGGWLLIRARKSDAERVLQKLPEIPARVGKKWRVEYEDFSLPPLYLFRIKLVEVE